VSTLLGEDLVEGAVSGRLVGRVVLPAAPEHATPCASEDTDRVGMIAATSAGALVDVMSPGMPVSGAVGEGTHVFAQPLVASPAERSGAVLAGLDRHGSLARIGGERVVGRVAGAVVADLGEQAGGGDDALAVAKEGEEDRSVEISLSRKENENYLTTQRPEVVL